MLYFHTMSIQSHARETLNITLGLWLAGYNDSISMVWLEDITLEPVIITPQAAFNLFTPKGTLDMVEQIRAKCPMYITCIGV